MATTQIKTYHHKYKSFGKKICTPQVFNLHPKNMEGINLKSREIFMKIIIKRELSNTMKFITTKQGRTRAG